MKFKIKLIIILAGTISLGACKKYLDKPLTGALEGPLLETKEGVRDLLIGTYAVLDGQQGGDAAIGGGGAWEASPDNWIYGGVAAGDANKGSDPGDQTPIESIQKFTTDPTNGFLNSKWKADYEGISRANLVLKTVAKVNGYATGKKENIIAQARFLRAHYYFDLKKMFDKVPYIDENTTDFNQPNNVDIWPKIEADFTYAYQNLLGQQEDAGRANKWAAGTYLAKTYLYEHKFPEARAIFETVVTQGTTANGQPYKLNDNFEDNFRAATNNSAESVFAVQAAANVDPNGISNANNGDMLNFPYGDGSPFGCCGFYQPSIDLVNHFRTNPATGLPYLDAYNDHPLKTDMGVSSAQDFTPDQGTVDPRLDWTAGRRGIPYLDWGIHPGNNWVRNQAYAGPYSPIKMVYGQAAQGTEGDGHSWAPGSGINNNIIRFADVLLMDAETQAQTGNLFRAMELVNMVRARAANPAGWVYQYKDPDKPTAGFSDQPAANYKVGLYDMSYFATKESALKAIYYERKIELALEGHRFFDLVRWGIAAQEINSYLAFQGKFTQDVRGGRFTAGKNEVYPIPQRQIDLSGAGGSPKLIQNKNY
ncbi:RagB/SusD family nutrient uptake outer membrane protein [Mucilaginibacter achroorhodeus]|uniref:RagB/SusD family nutrient uptake outer membrane protein n=1 Tax=Mucilaginibacter achroorhodeus TaxID=2599294 RepID=A0A563U5Y6_9SPHI|nr:RagB/SusD family nutrient uptake outer membrane protein [Mucilaginibacter achroorhodeus]TWR26745.1 RagB/SusD family nutrient uptake outer membrane protein [Mucilaginibacter achroorhodeus]